MKQENARLLIDSLREAGIDIVTAMTDSILKDALELLASQEDIKYVPVSNEMTGVAICSGAWLGGKNPALLMPTAGLLVASWPLASLNMAFGIPILLVIAYRGDIGDEYWYMRPYKLITEPLLNVLQIPYRIVNRPEDVKKSIVDAVKTARAYLTPVAILITGDVLW